MRLSKFIQITNLNPARMYDTSHAHGEIEHFERVPPLTHMIAIFTVIMKDNTLASFK